MKTREELIQDYVEGILAVEDQQAFDTLWDSDPTFREDVALQQELYAVLKKRLSGDEKKLRETLQETERSTRFAKGKVWAWRWWIVSGVAAACLLILGRLFLFPFSYYELPEMRSEIVRGDMDSEHNIYEDAVKAFNGKDYRKSTAILKALSDQDSTVVQYTYYLGLSLMGEKRFEDAKAYLLPLANGNTVFRNEANYYIAVVYNELGQENEAKKRLEMITTSSTVYAKAQELLNKLH